MKKKYSYNIPDELYVNSFSSNLVYSNTYNGPDTLYALVEDNMPVLVWQDTAFTTEYNHVVNKVVEVDAGTYPEVAAYLTNMHDAEFAYTYETITNIDGTTHDEISNPRLNDYYQLVYHESPDGINPWEFRLITRMIDFAGEEQVRKDLEYVKSFADKYAYESADQKLIDNYIKAANDFLEAMAPLKPWHFIEPPKNINVPKIPLALIKLFQSLPTT